MQSRLLSRIKSGGGFTLIEVIVSLIVAGILAAMLATFMGTSIMKSGDPVVYAKNGAYLNLIMENMTSDYEYQMILSPSNGLTVFKTNVETANKYSDVSHPYTVVDNYISFPSGSSVSAASASYTANASNMLQVTITYQNLSATAIFGG